MTSGIFEFDDHGRRLFRPHPPSFPKIDDVYDLLDPAQAALRELDRRLFDLAQKGTIGRLFARLDAVHSSGAEGSTTTFTDLMEYESALKIAPDQDDAAVVAAVAAGMEERPDDGGLEGLVLNIHLRLFESNRDRMVSSGAGAFKTSPNLVRDPEEPGGLFGYTAPQSLEIAMREWGAFTLSAGGNANELVRQLLSHWMFEHIHPVPDGNGRIGRLLVPIMLKSRGFSKTACAFFGEAVHEDKSLYIDALKDARISGNPTNYMRQMLVFISRTATQNLMRLDRLDAIETDWKKRFAGTRSDSVVHRFVSYAITKPVFTVRDAQNDLGVSFAAANSAVRALEAQGIVSVPADSRRNRLFHADEVLGIFDRFRKPVTLSTP
jgi:Fic family protein